jgi:dipeptidyl aminopeptidase/acylaminoacyl peptidase
MSVEEQVVRLFVAANPVPDPDLLEPLEPLEHLDQATLTEVSLVRKLPETDDVPALDLDADVRRRWPSRIRLVGGGLVAAGLVAVLVVVGRYSLESQTAADVPANGLIAFAGNQGGGESPTDIYAVAPDGTGLRTLTSTPELFEYAPAWSPDGSRLAFARIHSWRCKGTGCGQLVVVDPASGVETFSADIPQTERGWVPNSLAWSPDGRAIVTNLIACGVGGCGGGINSVIADLETGAFTTFTSPHQATWSPDGEWFSIMDGPALLLVPADQIGTGDVVDVAALSGVRPVLERPGDDAWDVAQWMPDSSALVVTGGSGAVSGGERIDVVTVPDGQRRTVIEDGFDPVVSPDGSQIAYRRGPMPSEVKEIWIAAADGSDPRLVTRLTSPEWVWTSPVWSPDGSLLLASDEEGWFTVQPDGTGRTEITPFIHPDNAACCWDNHPTWQPLPPDSAIAPEGSSRTSDTARRTVDTPG